MIKQSFLLKHHTFNYILDKVKHSYSEQDYYEIQAFSEIRFIPLNSNMYYKLIKYIYDNNSKLLVLWGYTIAVDLLYSNYMFICLLEEDAQKFHPLLNSCRHPS